MAGEPFPSTYLGVRSRPLLLRHVKKVNTSALIVATPLRYLQTVYLLAQLKHNVCTTKKTVSSR